jgi:hypothetical protein
VQFFASWQPSQCHLPHLSCLQIEIKWIRHHRTTLRRNHETCVTQILPDFPSAAGATSTVDFLLDLPIVFVYCLSCTKGDEHQLKMQTTIQRITFIYPWVWS